MITYENTSPNLSATTMVWPSFVIMIWLGFFGSSLGYTFLRFKIERNLSTNRVLSNFKVSSSQTFNFFSSSMVARWRPTRVIATLRIETDADSVGDDVEVIGTVD